MSWKNPLHCLQAGRICCYQVVSDLVVSTGSNFPPVNLVLYFLQDRIKLFLGHTRVLGEIEF